MSSEDHNFKPTANDVRNALETVDDTAEIEAIEVTDDDVEIEARNPLEELAESIRDEVPNAEVAVTSRTIKVKPKEMLSTQELRKVFKTGARLSYISSDGTVKFTHPDPDIGYNADIAPEDYSSE